MLGHHPQFAYRFRPEIRTVLDDALAYTGFAQMAAHYAADMTAMLEGLREFQPQAITNPDLTKQIDRLAVHAKYAADINEQLKAGEAVLPALKVKSIRTALHMYMRLGVLNCKETNAALKACEAQLTALASTQPATKKTVGYCLGVIQPIMAEFGAAQQQLKAQLDKGTFTTR